MKKIRKKLILWLKRIYLRLYLKWMFRLSGIKVKIAKTEREMQDIYKLRYRVYKNVGYIDPKNYPGGTFKDPYDKYSVNFLAYYKGKPAGIVRLVKDSELGYTLEKYYNTQLPLKGSEAVEVSRLAVDKKHRGGRRRVVLALLRSAFEWSKQNNIRYWYMFMPPKLAEAFEELGAIFRPLPQNKLTEENKKARQLLLGYFEKTKARLYYLDIEELNNNLHQMKIYW